MVMPPKVRDKLCKKCRKIILEYEREKREPKKEKLKAYRRKYYIEKEGGNKGMKEKLSLLKEKIDKVPDEDI